MYDLRNLCANEREEDIQLFEDVPMASGRLTRVASIIILHKRAPKYRHTGKEDNLKDRTAFLKII